MKKDLNPRRSRRGFTLLEILLAASIFAVVMVIATGIIGQSSTYQSRLNRIRSTSEEAKRLADMITHDVREANGKIDYNTVCDSGGTCFSTIPYYHDLIMKNGVTMSNYGTSVDFYDTPSGIDPASWVSSLTVAYVDTNGTTKYKVYVSHLNKIYYKEMTNFSDSLPDRGMLDSSNIISDPNLDVKIKFGGFAPKETATVKQQAYIQFYIEAETKNYDLVQVDSRARSEIKSAVTARNYNY